VRLGLTFTLLATCGSHCARPNKFAATGSNISYPADDRKPVEREAEAVRIRTAYAKRTSSAIYSLFEPAQLLMIQERERRLLSMLRWRGCRSLAKARILEIGCGNGFWLSEFIRWGARPENIVGVDLLPERIREAKHLCPGATTLECCDATMLSYETASFDLVLQATVFTSILSAAVKEDVATHMMRLVKRDGLIIWYDFHMNNPWNPDVRGVKKREIHRLFPGCRFAIESVTLAPPIARVVAPVSPALYLFLSSLKIFSTHYLGLITKE
jgi:SAM-dependent methyltransferase